MKFNHSTSIKTFKELYSVFGRRRHVVTFASLIPELPNELFSCRYCSWNLLCFLFHELGESRFSIFFKEGNENTKYIHYIFHKFSKFKWCITTEFMLGNFRNIIGEEICIQTSTFYTLNYKNCKIHLIQHKHKDNFSIYLLIPNTNGNFL